jgi:hypothetical protein
MPEDGKKLAVIGLIAGIGSFAGPIGALIFGPTAIGVNLISVACAYAQ